MDRMQFPLRFIWNRKPVFLFQFSKCIKRIVNKAIERPNGFNVKILTEPPFGNEIDSFLLSRIISIYCLCLCCSNVNVFACAVCYVWAYRFNSIFLKNTSYEIWSTMIIRKNVRLRLVQCALCLQCRVHFESKIK